MDPSCSHNSCDKTDRSVNMVDRSTETGNNGKEQIDDIERLDFEEENRIIKECSRLIVDEKIAKASPFTGPLSSGDSSIASSSETISTISYIVNDYNSPGCSKHTCNENSSFIKNIQPTKYDELSRDKTPPKPDFMQKLLNSGTQEKKDFPKGKLYKADAEALCEMEGDVRELDAVSGPSGRTSSNASSIASTSSDNNKDFSIQSTTNADRLLGLNDIGKSESAYSNSSGYMQNNCDDYEDSDEEDTSETYCTCLSSHEDDDDEDELDSEPQRLLMKRHYVDNQIISTKRFCSDVASTSSGQDFKRGSTIQSSNAIQPIGTNHNNLAQASPELKSWLNKFQSWTNTDKVEAINGLINCCAASQIRHMMDTIEPLFQRDFISLLPRELALTVLGYLEPKDLARAACTCRYWKFLADDNLLWKDQCKRIGIVSYKTVPRGIPRYFSPWKTAFMLQNLVDNNWLHKPVDKLTVMKGHDDHVITCLQFYGKRILSGSDDTTLKVWSAVSGRCIRTLVGHTGGVWSSQMIGNIVISGSTDRTLRVWDINSGRCLNVLSGHTSTVRCMHMYRHRVVSGSRDSTLRIWSIPDGECLMILIGHLAAVRCVQYNGKVVVSGAYDYFVKVWNPNTGVCLHTLSGHTNRVYSLQFDGVHVVSGSLDTTIRVWNVETGQLKHTLTGHQSLTSGMELRSNILVSGNADSTVKIWDIAKGRCLHTLAGPNKHQSAVTCLQSLKRFVITSSDDGTVKLWDMRTGEFIRNLVELSSGGSGGVVWRIKASSTQLVCAVGSRNGTEDTKLLVLNFDTPRPCRKCIP